MESNTLTAMETQNKIKDGECFVIDVREPEEFNTEHIPGAVNIPLSSLDPHALKNLNAQGLCVIQCQSGIRAKEAHKKLKSANSELSFSVLEGGLAAWKTADLEVISHGENRLPVMRVVQIIAGSLVLASTILGITAHPGFLAIPIFVGAGLAFAGITGWCGMAMLINKIRGE